MAKVLQLLRNEIDFNTREEARAALQTKLSDTGWNGGEPVIATFTEDSTRKVILGISAGHGGYTIFDPESIPADVQAALDAILGGDPDEAYDTLVKIANALLVINGDESTEGSIAKAEKDAKDYTDTQFDTINPYVSAEQVLKESTNYTEDEADKYEFTKHTGDKDELQLTFTPMSPLSLTVPETIGDIEKGTKCEALNGMPLSQVLDSLIFKTIYPTVTNPSASVRFANGFTSGALMEAGLNMPTDANMGYTLNRGTVKVDDGVTPTKEYVGEAIGCEYQASYTPGAADSAAGVDAGGAAFSNAALTGSKMTVGTYTFRAIVSYGQGPLMTTSKGTSPNPIKTSAGSEVANPHPAGEVTSSTISLKVTLPMFIDKGDGNYVKQSLQAWGDMKYSGVAMRDQSVDTPTRLKSPRKLQYANSFNAVSGKYDVEQLSNYGMQEISEVINGVSTKYFEYTWEGGALGAVNFEILTY